MKKNLGFYKLGMRNYKKVLADNRIKKNSIIKAKKLSK